MTFNIEKKLFKNDHFLSFFDLSFEDDSFYI